MNSIRTWQSPEELSSSPIASRDEFGPEVAKAIADLREAHGIRSTSCQPEGNQSGVIDRLRAELHEMLPGVNRRGFLRLTGAAAVFALAACNEKHPDTLVPYADAPEGSTLGKGIWYSTVLRDAGFPVAAMVKTYEGRPIKVEGNPDCPVGRGRADAITQAALVNLYDPDRLQRGPLALAAGESKSLSWDDLDAQVGAALKDGGVALVTPPVDGPAGTALIGALAGAAGKRFRHVVYRQASRAVEATARRIALGDASGAPTYQVGKAAVLLSLGSDILGEGTLADHIGFGELRALKGDEAHPWMGQVIAFEPTLSQLGTCADVRVRVPFDRLADVAWAIARVVAERLSVALPANAPAVKDLVLTLDAGGKASDAVAFAAGQLLAAKAAGRASLVHVGGAAHASQGSLSLHLAAVWLNSVLGNEGVTVSGGVGLADRGELPALVEALNRGEISTVILRDVNPVHAWPAFAQALAKAKLVVALADRIDESAACAQVVAPTLHGLESWGDAEIARGVYALQQPTVQRLWDARSAEESLIAFWAAAGIAPAAFTAPKAALPAQQSVVSRVPLWQAAEHGLISWQGFVRATWIATVRPQVKSLASEVAFWNAALASGVVTVTAPRPTPAIDAAALSAALAAAPFPRVATGYQLVLSTSRIVGDGTWLNNPWLNELPDPVSKITWDNYLAVSPADADKEGWKDGEVLAVTVGATTVALPVHIQDGQHPGTLETFLGWGRSAAGAVARLCIEDGYSVNAAPLATSRGRGEIGSAGLGATVARTGKHYVLANVQGHHRLEGRTGLARVAAFGSHGGHERAGWVKGTDGKPAGRLNLWDSSHSTTGHRWGMSVDLNACTGCNACAVACSAENNVPVVGRDEVRKHREMHWIRVDRYYTGENRLDVAVVHQPVMCQQCDNAPCEVVCPANATMHNEQGQNLMIYNRCIGTRYCANNCPYKVRRFNWYEYSSLRAGPQNAGDQLQRITKNLITSGNVTAPEELTHAPLQMLLNPAVTVRSKGVMEKCNLCVQRTREIRESEKRSNRSYQDGSVTTACAQTCPTKALVFGDLNDAFSEVVTTAKKAESRGYLLLDEELNTRPGIVYLSRLVNGPAAPAPTPDAHHAAGAHS